MEEDAAVAEESEEDAVALGLVSSATAFGAGSKLLRKVNPRAIGSGAGIGSANDDAPLLGDLGAGDDLVDDLDDDALAPVAFVASSGNLNSAAREKKSRERRKIEKEIEKLEDDLYGNGRANPNASRKKGVDVDSEAECDDVLMGRR